MPPETLLPYEEIARLPERVRALCARLDVPINERLDLARYLRVASDAVAIAEQHPSLELCLAQRVLSAILDCEGEAELREPLKRIAESPLDPASADHSPGKEALFELELLQYIRRRGLTARLGEPDVIISAPFGDYFVACKTINSLKGFEGQVRSGCRQVEARGYGCVAFNLEPHLLIEQPIHVGSGLELTELLNSKLRSLYQGHQRFIDERLESGRMDGAVLQISCFAKIADGGSDMDVFTHTVFYARSNVQEKVARERFEGFRQSMRGPMSYFMF